MRSVESCISTSASPCSPEATVTFMLGSQPCETFFLNLSFNEHFIYAYATVSPKLTWNKLERFTMYKLD